MLILYNLLTESDNKFNAHEKIATYTNLNTDIHLIKSEYIEACTSFDTLSVKATYRAGIS